MSIPRTKFAAFVSVGLVAVPLVTLLGCARAIPDAAAEPAQKAESSAAGRAHVPVSLVKVERGALARDLRAGGVLKQKSEVDLAFTVGGVLAVLYVDEGARVRRGQVLAQLDGTRSASSAWKAATSSVNPRTASRAATAWMSLRSSWMSSMAPASFPRGRESVRV